MPGCVFVSLADFQIQFDDWLTQANQWVVRTLKARPVGLLGRERGTMSPLPQFPYL